MNNCLKKIFEVIKLLQDNSNKIECNDNTCIRPFLGPNSEILCFNTRPVMLYKRDNSNVTLNYRDSNNNILQTTVFRIQNVSDDSVSVLLLEQNPDDETIYTNTNTYATLNLNCICAVKCLPDTIVNNI